MSIRRVLLAAIIAAGFGASAHAQCDTRFTLLNHSGETIREFYYGSSASSNWGPDRLGQNILEHTRSMNLSPAWLERMTLRWFGPAAGRHN